MRALACILFLCLSSCSQGSGAQASSSILISGAHSIRSPWSASTIIHDLNGGSYQVICTSTNGLKCWLGAGSSYRGVFSIPPAIAKLGLTNPRVLGSEKLLCGNWQGREVCFPNALSYDQMTFSPGMYMDQEIRSSDFFTIHSLNPGFEWNPNSISYDFTSPNANWPYLEFKVPLDSIDAGTYTAYINDGAQFKSVSMDNFFYLPEGTLNYYWGSLSLYVFNANPTPNAVVAVYPCWVNTEADLLCTGPSVPSWKLADGVDQLAKVTELNSSEEEVMLRFHRADGWHVSARENLLNPDHIENSYYDVKISESDVQDLIAHKVSAPWYIPLEAKRQNLALEHQFCSLDSLKKVHCWAYDLTVDSTATVTKLNIQEVTLNSPDLGPVDKFFAIQEEFCASSGDSLACWHYETVGDYQGTSFTNKVSPVMVDMKSFLP